MIPVEAAEKQANELKAELATLTESLEHDRARVNDPQAAVDTAVKQKDLAAQARDAAEKQTSELKTEIVTLNLKETLSRERNCTFALQMAADKEKSNR
jgi:chromosome segregation ATPase